MLINEIDCACFEQWNGRISRFLFPLKQLKWHHPSLDVWKKLPWKLYLIQGLIFGISSLTFFPVFLCLFPKQPPPHLLKKIFQFCWQFWESIHFQEIYESYWGFKNHCCEIEGHFTKHLARMPINCQGHDRHGKTKNCHRPEGPWRLGDTCNMVSWVGSATEKEHSWKLGDIQMKSEI